MLLLWTAIPRTPPYTLQPDAAQRFAEVKAAYQALTDPGARAAYEQTQRVRNDSHQAVPCPPRHTCALRVVTTTNHVAPKTHVQGGGGFGGWQDPLRSYGTGSTWRPSGQPRSPPEESYTFDQMLNDLGKELNDWSSQRRAKKGGREKSLWEELADIGEEFVEALEEVGD